MVTKNRLFSLLMGALFTLSSANLLRAEGTTQSSPRWSDLFKSYATSLVSGGAIGSMTGSLAFLASKTALEGFQKLGYPHAGLVMLLVIWTTEVTMRERLVRELNNGFTDHNIKHQKNFMFDAGLLASLGTFLALLSRSNNWLK